MPATILNSCTEPVCKGGLEVGFINVVMGLITRYHRWRKFGFPPGGCFLVLWAHFLQLSHLQPSDKPRVRQLPQRAIGGIFGLCKCRGVINSNYFIPAA